MPSASSKNSASGFALRLKAGSEASLGIASCICKVAQGKEVECIGDGQGLKPA